MAITRIGGATAITGTLPDTNLRDGAERADALAATILREVQDIVGFLHP